MFSQILWFNHIIFSNLIFGIKVLTNFMLYKKNKSIYEVVKNRKNVIVSAFIIPWSYATIKIKCEFLGDKYAKV